VGPESQGKGNVSWRTVLERGGCENAGLNKLSVDFNEILKNHDNCVSLQRQKTGLLGGLLDLQFLF